MHEHSPINASFLAGEWPASTDLLWNVIQPVKDPNNPFAFSEVQYPAYVRVLFFRTIASIDKDLQQESLMPGSFVSEVDSVDRTQRTMRRLTGVLSQELHEHNDLSSISVLYGVAPMYSALAASADKSTRERITSTIISGYQADQSVPARVLVEISSDILTSPLVSLNDDVVDTAHALAAIVCEVEEAKYGQTDRDIVRLLHETHGTPFEHHTQLYEALVGRMHEAGVVVSALFYKNIPFLEALKARIEHSSDDRWVQTQKRLLVPALTYPQDAWLMGEGLDTGIKGSTIISCMRKEEMIDESLLSDPDCRELIELLGKSTLRVGSFVDGLIKLNNGDIQSLVMFVSRHMADELARFALLKTAILVG
jgi:hypothetical protein